MLNTALGTLSLPFDVEVENSDAVGRGRFHVHNIATIWAARRTGTVTELSLLPTVAAPEPLLFLLVSRRGRTSENREQRSEVSFRLVELYSSERDKLKGLNKR